MIFAPLILRIVQNRDLIRRQQRLDLIDGCLSCMAGDLARTEVIREAAVRYGALPYRKFLIQRRTLRATLVFRQRLQWPR